MFVVFFKQKTAYEMRISDWSSDVCSSDLPPAQLCLALGKPVHEVGGGKGPKRDHPQQQLAEIGEGDGSGVVIMLDQAAQHDPAVPRSEEHTSELQSLMRISYAVFCLKKKKKAKKQNSIKTPYYASQ